MATKNTVDNPIDRCMKYKGTGEWAGGGFGPASAEKNAFDNAPGGKDVTGEAEMPMGDKRDQV